MMMSRLLTIVSLLAATTGAVASDLDWRDDPPLSGLMTPASTQPHLLYFTADWCGPCRLLEREVFDNVSGQAELDHFDLVRLDLDSDRGRAMADSFRVTTVPTFVMLASDGLEIERIRGYRSRRLLLHDLARFRAGDGTLGDLQRRLAMSPGDPTLEAALGLRYLERMEMFEAQVHLARGMADPSVLPDTLAAEAGRALADVYHRQGDAAAGAAVLEKLLHDAPDHAYPRVSWQMLARCRHEMGDAEGEVEAMREAAYLEPIRAEALALYARSAADLTLDLEQAEAAAREAVAMTEREDAEAMAALAQVLRRREDFSEAMLWIKRAVAAAPGEERWVGEKEDVRRAAIWGD